MTSRLLPVNLKATNWYDAQQVTETDLDDEQSRNIGIDSATENNFFGSGVLDEFPSPRVIFDSNNLNSDQSALLDAYVFDGQNIYVGDVETVSDTINGVNLVVELSNCRLDGAAYIKVSVIGDSFGDVLIHDDLIFNTNGSQITQRYKSIRAILFNNFAGSLTNKRKFAAEADGYNLIGRCVIREAMGMEVFPDTIIASQTSQPSIFWSDFYTPSYTTTINEVLQNAIGADKSLSELDIAMASVSKRELVANDVTTKIGQKFLSTGNNIQKISTLISVKYNAGHLPGEDGYEWSGDIVLTLHKLQTEVECPVAPTPDNLIDFDPDPTIIGQIALDSTDLLYQGVELDGYSKVVDFVFTENNISSPLISNIEIGKYYVFTISRSGSASVGTLLIDEATDRVNNSYMVVYDGTQWVNVTDSDMWFAIYGNYVEVSDGIAYNDGVGVQIPRIQKDSSTNTEAPYILGDIPFYSSSDYNYVLLETANSYSEPKQDQRTGNQVYSRFTPEPNISLISESSLNSLLEINPDPVLLAKVFDSNPRGNISHITGETCLPGLVIENKFNIIRPNADIIQNKLVGSIMFPSTSCGGSDCEFRIIKQTLYTDAYGDVNGDGEIDLDDLQIVSSWIDAYGPIDINNSSYHYLFYNGYIDTMQFLRADVTGDGKVDLYDLNYISNYINRTISTFPAGSTFLRTELVVEKLLDETMLEIADIPSTCCTSFISPMISCIPWRIDYFPTWIPDLINTTDLRRLLATTFTETISETHPGGQNNFFIPGDLLLDGNILNPDGSFYSVDLEVSHLTLDFPVTDSSGNPLFLDGYTGLLLFENFVAESSNGLTFSGFNAMKYADGSYVQISDFANNKIKITASLQSIANEYNIGFGGSIKDLVGLYYDPTTSLLTLYIDKLYDDLRGNLIPSLSTKILLTIYLKHSGFINQTTTVTKTQLKSLLGV